MKRTVTSIRPFIILMLIQTVFACTSPFGRNEEAVVLDCADSLLEANPDSTLHLLESIDYNTLNEEGQALYGLFFTAAKYKLYQPVDTNLINHSIDYYSTSPHQEERAGAALYYKGGVCCDLGDYVNGINCLKAAETFLSNSSDFSLLYKIHENLAYVNFNSKNYDLSLRYALSLVKDAVNLDSTELTVDAYDKLAGIYTTLGMNDSANAINAKNLYLIDHVSDSSKAYTLPNIASNYYEQGQYQRAKELLLKVLPYHPKANAYLLLAKISCKEGDTAKAYEYLKQLEMLGEPEYLMKAHLVYSDMEASAGRYNSALSHRTIADSIKDMMSEKSMMARIAEIQMKYDKALVEKQMATRTMAFFTVLVIILLFLILLVVSFFWRVSRLHQSIATYKLKIDEGVHKNMELKAEIFRLQNSEEADVHLINELQNRVARQEKEIENYMGIIDSKQNKVKEMVSRISLLEGLERMNSETIDELREEVRLLQETTTAKLGLGKNVYERILSDDEKKYLNSEELAALVAYYTYSHYEQFSPVLNKYHSLPLQLSAYLVLSDMNISDDLIKEVFGVERNTVRGYRFRLKKYEK